MLEFFAISHGSYQPLIFLRYLTLSTQHSYFYVCTCISLILRFSLPVVKWVEGDVGEVAMQVFNPMPFDMKVSKMVSGKQREIFQDTVVYRITVKTSNS